MTAFSNFRDALETTRGLFTFLDRQMTRVDPAHVPIYQEGLSMFTDALHQSKVTQGIIPDALEHVNAFREGQHVDLAPMAAFISMLRQSGAEAISTLFVDPLLAHSEQWLKPLQHQYTTLPAPELLQRLVGLEERDIELCRILGLPLHTLNSLRTTRLNLLFKPRMTELTEKSLAQMVHHCDAKGLKALARLLRWSGQDVASKLTSHFRAAAIQDLSAIVNSAEDHQDSVILRLADHRSMLVNLALAFEADAPAFLSGVSSATTAALSKSTNTPHHLAAFTDRYLRGELEHLPLGTAESMFSYIMSLFRCLDRKDYFVKAMAPLMMLRIMGSLSDTARERDFLTRLQKDAGNDLIQPLLQIMADTRSLFAVLPDGAALALYVLTRQATERHSDEDQDKKDQEPATLVVPPIFSERLGSMLRRYTKRFGGSREVSLMPALGFGTLEMSFPSGSFDAIVPTSCMFLLCDAREHDTLTEASERLGMEPVLFRRALQTLCFTDQRLCLLMHAGEVLHELPESFDNVKLMINPGFVLKSGTGKVVLPLAALPQKKTVVAKKLEFHPARHQQLVDACLCRLIKKADRIKEEKIISGLREELFERVEVPEDYIKKRIEEQINRDNIERDEDNTTIICWFEF
eukprot:gnl/Dysnectes_brevis/956_a1065_4290.p1 GENE.gnl/Dysnectes_brevis/956_a1065_4290~~gnl/Dysnectes_brevis/956_a1065_4290.p1  ORF type:complete len:731 (-),score=260.33 gnl/Dysnectes_brevis/956_a1065_4290:39-1940(-)